MLIINSMGGMTFRNLPPGMLQMTAWNSDNVDTLMQAGDCILLLEGGADINPALYGEEDRYSYYHEARDRREIMLYNLARKYNVPMLGICRGHQLMAALAGGTLYQDLAKDRGKDHRGSHKIIFTECRDTSFLELMQSNPYGSPDVVNSLHHQGINRVPASCEILAYAEDGLVEAVRYPYGISVQWHPELMGHIEFLLYMQRVFLQR